MKKTKKLSKRERLEKFQKIADDFYEKVSKESTIYPYNIETTEYFMFAGVYSDIVAQIHYNPSNRCFYGSFYDTVVFPPLLEDGEENDDGIEKVSYHFEGNTYKKLKKSFKRQVKQYRKGMVRIKEMIDEANEQKAEHNRQFNLNYRVSNLRHKLVGASLLTSDNIAYLYDEKKSTAERPIIRAITLSKSHKQASIDLETGDVLSFNMSVAYKDKAVEVVKANKSLLLEEIASVLAGEEPDLTLYDDLLKDI